MHLGGRRWRNRGKLDLLVLSLRVWEVLEQSCMHRDNAWVVRRGQGGTVIEEEAGDAARIGE